MIFKLFSRDINSHLQEVTSDIRTSFHINGSFLYFRGVKVGICNYPTIFKDGKLYVEKGEIIETYDYKCNLKSNLKSAYNYFDYEVTNCSLRVYDLEKTISKEYKFEKIIEINDGIIIKDQSVRFLSVINEEIELNNECVIEDIILVSSNGFNLYKKGMKEMPLREHIELLHNIIIPEIIVENNLYHVRQNVDNKIDDLFATLPNDEYYLSEVGDVTVSYNSTGKLLVFINEIFLCRDIVTIKGITLASCFTVEEKLIKIVVTISEVFMIYNHFISYFHHKEVIYHINQTYNGIPTLSSLNGNIDLDKLYFTLILFSDLPIRFEGLESFLFDLFIYTNLGKTFLEKIYTTKGWSTDFETILCNIYRFVDDKNKQIINEYILKIEDLINLKKIIIFHHDLIPIYIVRCVKELREYEIEDLIEHFRNSNVLNEIALELLKHNCFYLFTLCYPEYEEYFDKDLLKIEKYNMISQKNRSN